jgi:hypothetical protein
MIAPRFLYGLILFLYLCPPALADLPPSTADWNLAREQEGIRIYSLALPDSDFDAFKAVTVLDAPLNNVMAVMADPQSCVEWVHGCAHSEGLDNESFNDRSAYSVNDLPWPAQDRDYVIHIHTRTETAGDESTPRKIILELNAMPEARKKSSGRVRVEHSDTLYQFYEQEDGRTHMTWIQHTEPNGALPSWLVNSLAIDIPFKSLQRLETLANTPGYSDHKLIFDESGQLTGVQDTALGRSPEKTVD